MDIDLIKEEIAINLIEKFLHIDEEYGETAALDYISSLTEDEIDIILEYNDPFTPEGRQRIYKNARDLATGREDQSTTLGYAAGTALDWTPGIGTARALSRYNRGESSGWEAAGDVGLSLLGPLGKGAHKLYKAAKAAKAGRATTAANKADDLAQAYAKRNAANVANREVTDISASGAAARGTSAAGKSAAQAGRQLPTNTPSQPLAMIANRGRNTTPGGGRALPPPSAPPSAMTTTRPLRRTEPNVPAVAAPQRTLNPAKPPSSTDLTAAKPNIGASPTLGVTTAGMTAATVAGNQPKEKPSVTPATTQPPASAGVGVSASGTGTVAAQEPKSPATPATTANRTQVKPQPRPNAPVRSQVKPQPKAQPRPARKGPSPGAMMGQWGNPLYNREETEPQIKKSTMADFRILQERIMRKGNGSI